jgi:hypothetical protein
LTLWAEIKDRPQSWQDAMMLRVKHLEYHLFCMARPLF